MSSPLVSIIVPVFNTNHYLDKCITSLTNQRYKNIEIILINDGSTDNSLNICLDFQKTDHRIIVINQNNLGLSAARNAGLEKAKGLYISFVDSDDYVDSDFISANLDYLAKYNAQISVSCFYSVDEKTGVINPEHLFQNKKLSKKYKGSEALTQLAKGKVQSYVCNKIFKAELFKDLRFQVGKKYEDVYIMHHLFFKSKNVIFINKPFYYYLQRVGSITHDYKQHNLEMLFDALLCRHEFLSQKKMYKQCAYNLFNMKLMLRNLRASQKNIDFNEIERKIKQNEKKCSFSCKFTLAFLNIGGLLKHCRHAIIRHLKLKRH